MTKREESKIDYELIVYALTEYYGRCPKCFWNIKGGNCGSCDTYYGDCDCTPLTPDEIKEGWQ